MSRVLITGVSSGIGKALTKKLINNGYIVWGIARRKKLLTKLEKDLSSNNFFPVVMDVSERKNWIKFASMISEKRINFDVCILNAAVNFDDLENGFNTKKTEQMIKVNFLGVMYAVEKLLKILKKNSQIITVSSFSAFKGNGLEGVGYAASKAALSIAFESLHQRYKSFKFKTIFFGPIDSGMSPYRKKSLLVMSEAEAVDFIIEVMNKKGVLFYKPAIIFLGIKLIKLLPQEFYFKILSRMEKIRMNIRKP